MTLARFITCIASFNAQAKHAGSLESPVEYGMFDATWSLASDVCNLLSPCRRLAEESFADTNPTSVLTGKSCTAHLRIANRKKLQDSCILTTIMIYYYQETFYKSY